MQNGDFLDASGLHVDNVIDVLNRTFEKKKLALNNGSAILIENIRSNDDVGNAGFVFEADEDEAFGCSWPLARDHAAGHADITAIGCMREIDGAKNAETVQPFAAIGHRMRADGHAGAVEVRDETFFVGHDLERRRLVLNFNSLQ